MVHQAGNPVLHELLHGAAGGRLEIDAHGQLVLDVLECCYALDLDAPQRPQRGRFLGYESLGLFDLGL
jgi:hypothetical protein